jgi:hypothetical protein
VISRKAAREQIRLGCPTAQTMLAPGLVDAESSRLGLPLSGLATVLQAVPFQFRVRVCVSVVPAGV